MPIEGHHDVLEEFREDRFEGHGSEIPSRVQSGESGQVVMRRGRAIDCSCVVRRHRVLRRVAHGAPCKRRCSDTAILVGIADYGDSPLLLLSLFRLDTFNVASLASLSWSQLL
jgi:hypothetical protein